MLNFNVDPYYDDFDPNKNFHRVLFKPGRAVQARELTQSQTILQDQISKFANHIFKQNTPVTGGQVTVNTRARYLKLTETFNDNDVVASDFLNQIITDSTGIIFAKVIATEETVSGDPPTLVVTYLSGKEFSAGDTILGLDTNTLAQIVHQIILVFQQQRQYPKVFFTLLTVIHFLTHKIRTGLSPVIQLVILFLFNHKLSSFRNMEILRQEESGFLYQSI